MLIQRACQGHCTSTSNGPRTVGCQLSAYPLEALIWTEAAVRSCTACLSQRMRPLVSEASLGSRTVGSCCFPSWGRHFALVALQSKISCQLQLKWGRGSRRSSWVAVLIPTPLELRK